MPSTQENMRSVDRLGAERQAVGLTEAVAVRCQGAFKKRSAELGGTVPGAFGIVSATPGPSRPSLPKAVFDRPSVTSAARVLTLTLKGPSGVVRSPPLAPSPAQKS